MKAAHFRLVAFFLFGVCIVHSQDDKFSQSDTIHAKRLYEQGLALQKSAKHDSAIVCFDRSAVIYAQLNSKSNQFRSLIKKAESLRSRNIYEKALDAIRIDQADEELLLKENPGIAVQRLVMIGSITRQQGKYDTTLTVARTAQNLFHILLLSDLMLEWDIYTLLAGVYFNTGNHDSAFAYNNRALRLFPSPTDEEQLKISNTYNSIAGIYEARGDYKNTLEYFSRSLSIHRALRGEHHPDVGRLYGNVAVAHFRLGDYDLALEYYFKSLAVLNEMLESGHTSIGVNYNNIAMAYRNKGEFDKAVEYGEKSRAIFEKKLGVKHANVAGVVNNIGRTYFDMKQYDKALEYYQAALSVWKESLGEKHPNVLQSYFNIGEAYGNMKQFDEAKRWLTQSLKLRRETLGDKNVKVAQSYNALGTIYSEKGYYDTAANNFQHAVIALLDGFDDSTISENPITVKSSSDLDLLASLSGKARALLLRGTNINAAADLRISLDTYDRAIQLVENKRRGFGSEGSKLQLSRMSFDVYERAIASAMKLFEMTKDASYISTAFSFAERSKAGILQDAISELNAKEFAGIPDSMLEQETSLRIDLTYNETQLQKEKEKREKSNKTKIAQWENTIFDLKRRYEQLIAAFEKEYPDYYSLRHQSAAVTVNEIQEHLPDAKTALVEYVVSDSSVTIFAITKKKSIAVTQHLTSLTQRVKQFRRSIQNIESKEYISLAGMLYAQLLAPVQSGLKGIQKLYIVPDGILNHLPFEALLTKQQAKSEPVDFSSLPYVIRRYDISYQVSGRFLGEIQKERRRTDDYSFVGLAPVFADKPSHSNAIYAASTERITRSRTIDGEEFVELKESENEVRDIFKLFKTHKKQAAMYLHAEADESKLKAADIGTYRFIHIATHGIINEERPNLSGIIFTAPNSGTAEDGILYSGEIYNLRLNAEMVVLSACETGLGTIVKGEGMLGLTRGFIYAGAKNLLVSLWQVADKSTAELMVQFYQNVLNNQSYQAALRNAKLAMIKKGKYAHPVEWSPFVLTGQ